MVNSGEKWNQGVHDRRRIEIDPGGRGAHASMAERHDPEADAVTVAADAWRAPFANAVGLAVTAAAMLWGGFREFTPPPEEPESLEQLFADTDEVMRWAEEFEQLSRERSRITDAIDKRIKVLEAQRSEEPHRAGLRDELRQLRESWLAEMETTNRLLREKNAAMEEKKLRKDAVRQEQVARAAADWQRGRWKVLAMAGGAAALAGWLFLRARTLRRQFVASAGAEAGGGPQAEAPAAADPALVEERDRQQSQKIPFFLFQVAICIGVLLLGLFGPAPQAGAKDERAGFVFLGLFGLATSTIWLFFGSIDWSTWNAIKGRLNGREADGNADGTRDDPR